MIYGRSLKKWFCKAGQAIPMRPRARGRAEKLMGAVARNRWKRLFIGATAERTLEFLPCDLLIVKPDWFETPVSRINPDAARPITTMTR